MPRHPNILWIQTDEQRPDSLGCYGSAWAKTPNLDELARRGVTFQNAVCQSPVCVPSRSSQLTGRYPSEINVLFNNVAGCDGIFPPQTETFPEILARVGGYQTLTFGKAHTPKHPIWERVEPMSDLSDYAGPFALNPRYDEAEHHVIKMHRVDPLILAGTYPTFAPNPSHTITDWAIEWLRDGRDANRPFLVRVSHNWPHTPVLAPPPFDRLYHPDEIPIQFYDEQAYRSRALYNREIADEDKMSELSREQIRQIWKDYMGLCAYVDYEVGRLLAALQALGLEEDTIICFSSDHGKALGEWGAGEKGYFDAEVWRVPFVWSWPQHLPQGEVRSEGCELLDMGRTLLGLAGLSHLAPRNWRGRDLFDAQVAAPDAVFGQIGWPNQNSVLLQREDLLPEKRPHWFTLRLAIRTARFRLDESWMRDGKRLSPAHADGNLFDLEADPQEKRNLWGEASHQKTVLALREQLEAWWNGLEHKAELFEGESL